MIQYYILLQSSDVASMSSSCKLLVQATEQLCKPSSRQCANLAFVPRHKSAVEEDIQRVQDYVTGAERLLVITGAGAWH